MINDTNQKVLVIADIHGNREALQAIVDSEGDFDIVLFLGDSVSPGPQPTETLELLRSLSGIQIYGNHDLEMLDASLTQNWPPPWRAFNDWVRTQLSHEDLEFLRDLNEYGDYRVGNADVHLCHGYVPGRVRHLIPHSPDDDFNAIAQYTKASTVFFGHSHVQFRRRVGNREFINPGSVGQNRCGKVLACYGVIEENQFEHRQVSYDPSPWISALHRVQPLDEYPEFRAWFEDSLLSGFGIGKTDPWTRLARDGYC
ncbi:MAG: metallophosphoesterase family protein [Gammaproteobacteria bacterium]|nr:metallophosphoesterase family protein [Gammaproteobacteria bacterium]